MVRVLIVDDREESRYFLSTLLKSSGYEVESACNGAEALERARQNPPQLVISDLLMPVMDGYTLLHQWRADPRLKQIPFLVYTATYTDPKDEQLALSLGADAFILKPTEPEDFIARLKQVLANPGARGVTATPPPAPGTPTGVSLAAPQEEERLLQQYSDVLIHKLEDKMEELDKANRELKRHVTEHKRAEEEARHLATFPQLNPNPVLEFAANGGLVYSNRAAQVLAESAGDGDLLGLLPPKTPQIISECLASGQPCLRVETQRNQRTLSWSFYPIAENRVVHCYVGDITDRLKLEEQFRQAQKMEAIGHLAAGVAHDFNNLLTIVQLESSALALNSSLDAETRNSVSQIAKAADRAANLTRQLLTFSRKPQKESRLLDLSELVEDLGRLLNRILGENITLRTHVTPGLPHVLADPGMIEQVLMNLAVNSRDAMPDGGQLDLGVSEVAFDSVAVQPHPGGRPGRFLQIEVRDTGGGIATENLPRIFEPFFTTKEVGKGTGLGLATVFAIVKQHDGWIEVTSELGRGTVFRIFLPAATDAAKKQVGADLPAEHKGGHETILVVEDEESIRRLLQVTLERYGYRVLIAENGTEAVETVTRHGAKIDLLITDLVMPGGMNGQELAQMLQTLFADLKVVFVSGYASDSVTRNLVLESGVNFLRKPFSTYAILDLVRRCLDGARRTDAPAG